MYRPNVDPGVLLRLWGRAAWLACLGPIAWGAIQTPPAPQPRSGIVITGNVVTGQILNGELPGEALPGVTVAAIEEDGKRPFDQRDTGPDGRFRLLLPADVTLFRLYAYHREARFFAHRQRKFTKIEHNPLDLEPVTLYASLESTAELQEQVAAVRALASLGDPRAAEQLDLVLKTNFPVELADRRCGAEVVNTAGETAPRGRATRVAVPSLIRARISSNESAAIGDLRTMLSAQAAYQSAFGGRYGTISNLVRPPGPDRMPRFLDEAYLRGGRARNGYELNLQLAWAPRSLKVASLSLFALAAEEQTFRTFSCPEKPGVTGVRFFYTDQTAVIRQSNAPIVDPLTAEPVR
jgi:hypothetical protein